jgi:VWFA-related protein
MKGIALVVAALAAFVQTPLFRTSVDAVMVDALVVDGRKPIAGLTAGDFELLDSGVPQTLDSIAMTDVPIRMMVTLDTSQSVAGDTLDQLKRGVQAAIAALQPPDRAALITFSADVRLLADWNADTEALRRTVADLRAAGGTSLWDAAFAALTLRDETPTVRRLVLLFSDGE